MTLKDDASLLCPVCGYPGSSEEAGNPGSKICPCCGFTFSTEATPRSHLELRDQWIVNGLKWHSKHRQPPEDWDPKVQLRNAGVMRLKLLAINVMRENPAMDAGGGRILFYQESTNTLVIINNLDSTQSTIMRPPGGRAYVDKFLKGR